MGYISQQLRQTPEWQKINMRKEEREKIIRKIFDSVLYQLSHSEADLSFSSIIQSD